MPQAHEPHAAKPERAEVESFQLDHTKVVAPYVRLIGCEHGPAGDVISNYDIRLAQPNETAIETGGLHTLEHMLATSSAPAACRYIDCSPFGCRTGSIWLLWGEHDTHEVACALKAALEDIAYRTTWEDVPGTEPESCGNYRDHSLFSAQEWARRVLDQGISSDPFTRACV